VRSGVTDRQHLSFESDGTCGRWRELHN
jgi:hypothetical protein